MTTRKNYVAQVEHFLAWDKQRGQKFAHGYYIDVGANEYIVGETATGDLCLFYIRKISDSTGFAGLGRIYQALGWTNVAGSCANKTLEEIIAIALEGKA